MKLEFSPFQQASGNSLKLSVNLKSAQRSQTAAQLNDRTTLNSEQSQEKQITPTLTASNILQAVDTAVRAVSSIAELRAQQRDVAVKGYNLPEFTKQHTDLVSEFNNLQNEIDRVQSSATYNGQNLLTGSTTFELIDSNKSVNEVISLGSVSSATSSSAILGGLSAASGVANRSNSYTVINASDQNQTTLSAIKANRNSANSKAEELPERAASADINITKVKEVNLGVSEATELAQQIARKLRASLRAPQVAETLIAASAENLDPEKVKSLLE